MKGTNLNLSFSLEKIYENANFEINDLDKVGVVGVNGAGKTTLFKVILHEQELDSGKISVLNKRIGYLPQEIVLDDKDITVFDYIMAGRPIKKLEGELVKLYDKVAVAPLNEQNKLLKEIAKTQSKLEYYDYYQAENIMLKIIDDMKIDASMLDMKLCDLSGGQKSKVAFARLLYSNPEILLLDEPTNHLDVYAKESLKEALKAFKGTIVLVCHEPDFYQDIVTNIFDAEKWTTKIL